MNVALSEAMATHLRAHGAPSPNIVVIPNFADGKAIGPADEVDADERRIDDGQVDGKPRTKAELTVMYAGNLGRVHEFDPALKAGIELSNDSVDWCIVGDGAQLASVQDYWRNYHLQRLRFTPPVPESSLPALLRSCTRFGSWRVIHKCVSVLVATRGDCLKHDLRARSP
jgi:glycosyltransferase involved in cell wall biosynthesis